MSKRAPALRNGYWRQYPAPSGERSRRGKKETYTVRGAVSMGKEKQSRQLGGIERREALFQILTDGSEEGLHFFSILVFDNLQQVTQFFPDLFQLLRRERVEQNLLQKVIVLRHQPLGNSHVPFECGTRSLLMTHH